MYKKIIVPLILALVTTMAFSNVAYAATSAPSTATVRNVGTITSVDAAAGSFKLATIKGQHLTIHVNSNTVYRGRVSSFAGLAPSMYANVQTTQLSNGSYLAVVVNVLKQHISQKVTGQVTKVLTSFFTILGTDGKTYTFDVTGKTTFSGFGVTILGDLLVGMKVKVTYLDMGNGVFRAQNVVVTQLHSKISGKVTSKATSSFTILGSDGFNYTFQVTSKTTFSGNNVTSYSGLKVNMKVKVSYVELTDGTLRAVSVIVNGR